MSLTSITERPGLQATEIQVARLLQRYQFVRSFADETSDVLEVACGSGMGLPYLVKRARTVTGTDVDPANIELSRELAQGHPGITVSCCDGHVQPYDDASFDVVSLLEAVYYLEDPPAHVAEVHRLLKPGGRYILSTVNCEMEGFHPSPHAQTYFEAHALRRLLSSTFSQVEIYGGFPQRSSAMAKTVMLCKKAAVRFNLIPGSLAARAYLKRVFIGRTSPLPLVVDDAIAAAPPPMRITNDDEASRYTILYAVATKA